MIGIIDTGFGNIQSINNIYFEKNIRTKIISNIDDFNGIDKIILPGIGSFDALISNLSKLNFNDILNELVIIKKIPILGICLGMQVFFNSSQEGSLKGFGWIKDNIEKMNFTGVRLPHMGWNQIYKNNDNFLFKDISDGGYFYFLHSYGNILNKDNTHLTHLTYTTHGKKFVSSINYKNIYGVQFHPEKSHSNGMKLLTNFAQIDA
jgi:imidazole glycerol-phosphate synthase subunit HisH